MSSDNNMPTGYNVHKRFYTDFSRHCFRLYCRKNYDDIDGDIGRMDYLAAEKAYMQLSEKEREVITYAYTFHTDPDTQKEKQLINLISEIALDGGLSHFEIQKILQRADRLCAVERQILDPNFYMTLCKEVRKHGKQETPDSSTE